MVLRSSSIYPQITVRSNNTLKMERPLTLRFPKDAVRSGQPFCNVLLLPVAERVHGCACFSRVVSLIECYLRSICLWSICFGLQDLSSTFPNGLRPLCTTMPWTIWPVLVVLWGVCWMFYEEFNLNWEDQVNLSTTSDTTGLFEDIDSSEPFPGDCTLPVYLKRC